MAEDTAPQNGLRARIARQPVVQVAKRTAYEWIADKAPQLAAAVAFFSIFSLAPILILVVVIAGFFFGEGPARQQLLQTIREVAGPDIAETLSGILTAANEPSLGGIAALVGIVTFLFGATAVFAQLQSALNQVWDVKPIGGGVKSFLMKRVTGLGVVVLVGILLTSALLASTALAALAALLPDPPGGLAFWRILNVLVSLALVTVLFGLLFQYLPDVRVAWRDVWTGALFTAALFVLGKEILGIWLASSGVASVYGAAGSLVVLLLWIYYNTLIFFLGAEFTQVYANTYGTRPEPEPHARRLRRRYGRRRDPADNP